MYEYILLTIGITLIGCSLIKMAKHTESRAEYNELNQLIVEAKLVQESLKKMLPEITEATNILVEKIENASIIYDNNVQEKMEKVEENIKCSEENNILPLQPLKPNKYEQVTQLANRGLTIEDIAKELSIGRGEVQLYLNLTNKESSGDA